MNKDPSGALLNLFLLLVFDKNIAEVLAEQGIELLQHEQIYVDKTFGELQFENVTGGKVFDCEDAEYDLCWSDQMNGLLRVFNIGPFDYIKYIKKHNEVEK